MSLTLRLCAAWVSWSFSRKCGAPNVLWSAPSIISERYDSGYWRALARRVQYEPRSCFTNTLCFLSSLLMSRSSCSSRVSFLSRRNATQSLHLANLKYLRRIMFFTRASVRLTSRKYCLETSGKPVVLRSSWYRRCTSVQRTNGSAYMSLSGSRHAQRARSFSQATTAFLFTGSVFVRPVKCT